MGGTSYSVDSRSLRSVTKGYASVTTSSASFNKVFEQQEQRKAHASMMPKDISLREARYSEAHPNVVPILLALDVTGSMGYIPKYLVAEGLPKIMEKLLAKNIDPALLFTAVGDHIADNYPFQVGQFESGDEELDMWLTRTYIEGNGGANAGESYMIPWYFASKYVQTDPWDKHNRKGILITIGDEPVLPTLPSSFINSTFKNPEEKTFSSEELLKLAQERFKVFHIHVEHGNWNSERVQNGWKQLLNQNLVISDGQEKVVDCIIDIITQNTLEYQSGEKPSQETPSQKTEENQSGDPIGGMFL